LTLLQQVNQAALILSARARVLLSTPLLLANKRPLIPWLREGLAEALTLLLQESHHHLILSPLVSPEASILLQPVELEVVSIPLRQASLEDSIHSLLVKLAADLTHLLLENLAVLIH